VLSDDGTLEMSTDYLNNQPAVVLSGTWEPREGGRLLITLAAGGATTVTFERDGDFLRTIGPTDLFGSAGLTLISVGR
jgi:hypothetical protein